MWLELMPYSQFKQFLFRPCITTRHNVSFVHVLFEILSNIKAMAKSLRWQTPASTKEMRHIPIWLLPVESRPCTLLEERPLQLRPTTRTAMGLMCVGQYLEITLQLHPHIEESKLQHHKRSLSCNHCLTMVVV